MQSDRVTPAVTAQQVGTGGGAQIQALAAEWIHLHWFPELLGVQLSLGVGVYTGFHPSVGFWAIIMGNFHALPRVSASFITSVMAN